MKWVLTICAILAVGAGMVLGCLGHDKLPLVGVLGSIVFLTAANIDRIKELKVTRGGIEARMRDVVTRAENAVTELQLLAVKVADLTLSLVWRQGRLGGYDDDERERIRESVLGVLKELRVSEEKMEEVLREVHRITEYDYVHAILGGHEAPDGMTPETIAEWKALRRGGFKNIPSSEVIRAFLAKYKYLTPDRQEYLADYEYYRANRKHRRPEVWRNRGDWGRLRVRP